MSTTNNRMELKAFINGIKEAIKLRDNNEEIVINTDSAYIYNCLTRG
jgi:ribonuclease HI